MKSKLILAIICFTVFGLNGCGLLSKKYTKTETVTHSISATGKTKLKLENIVGSITISRSNDSNSITLKAHKEIKVKKKYLDTPFDEIDIKMDTVSGIVSITTEINKQGDDNIFNLNIDRDQRVDYEIQIPVSMNLDIENVSGNIVTNNLSNDMKIDLINGDADLENYTGRLECDITNGDFTGHIDSTRGIEINTINGNVSLFLNNYMSVNVRAETVNGKISDEELQFKNTIKEKGLFKGTLGNGDSNTDIKIETVNGRIKLYGRNEI